MRSIPIPEFYRIWQSRLLQDVPDECDSRMANLIWLMMGIYLAGSVQLDLIARKVPIRAKKLSIVKRLHRFLDNKAVHVRTWYAATAIRLIQSAAAGGQVRLIIDCSKVSFGHQLLMVAIAYHRRALPLAWTWVPHRQGHSSTAKQVKLLAYVQDMLPEGVKVLLVGDCEFGHPLLMENLRHWGWDYVLRQPGDHLFMPKGETTWRHLDSLAIRPGMLLWLGNVVLTQASAYSTHLTVYWQPGEDKPWFLATNLPSPHAAIRAYRLRMWIEGMFGDLKDHGFDLEASHLRRFLRLSRLTLAVCLLYVWLVAVGEYLIGTAQTDLVTRHDRVDLSIFRLGFDFIDRCFALHDPLPDAFIPNFCSVSGR
jgi:hypothetical protein